MRDNDVDNDVGGGGGGEGSEGIITNGVLKFRKTIEF